MRIPRFQTQPIDGTRPQAWTPSNKRSRMIWINVSLTAYLLLFACTLPAQTPKRGSALDPLHQFNSALKALVKEVSPSVVQVLATGYGAVEESSHSNMGLAIEKQRSIGSGVIVDPNGYIVTNAHVVAGAQRVQVIIPTLAPDQSPLRSLVSARGQIVEAQIIGTDRELDLALLKVDRVGLPPLPLGNYSKLRQGELVFSFGSPQGLSNSVTSGVVSSTARQLDPDSPMVYIQTDAPINPGNSGGPLVNVDGEVVGINTFILSQSGGNEGLGFAIPSSVVNVAYQQLRKFGHIHRMQIGIGAQTISPTLAAAMNLPRNYGVIVSDVLPDSPALAVGVRVGDVLLTVDGRAADSVPYVSFRLMSVNAGAKVHLEVLRGKEKLAFDVPVVEPPHEMDQVASLVDPVKNLVRPLGIIGVEIDQKIAAMAQDLRDPFGIIVVARSSEGADIPLATGDVIRTLNGRPMTTLERLRAALPPRPPGAPVVLQIQRDQRLLFVAFTLDQL